jgi:glyoxylase-like metal-dependent hydrolase (beta-lactamase superfamily II)
MNDPNPKEIATGVYCLSIGTGIYQSNVYFVQSGSSWALIDTAWRNRSQLIKTTAESLFGMDKRPAAILLTHIHPDHSGSAPELAQIWRVPVYVHPDEIPLASGKLIPEYFNPLDRWLIVPLMKLMPRQVLESKLSEASLADAACAIDPDAGVPGLPDWQCIPTPGHTPGRVFWRAGMESP